LSAGLGEIEKMDEIGPVKVIRYNFGPKILVIFLVSLVVTVTTVLFYVGNTGGRIGGGIGILFVIWLAFKTRHHMRVFLVPFKPAFIIYTEGIKFGELFVEWEQIKEIVVFNFEGRKHFGFRLKDDLTTLQGRDINECMKGNFDWSVFKMPFATMYKALSTPASDIIEMLHSQYGLKVRYKDEDVGIGNENEI
jgi:hypothetical protein